MLLVDNNGKIFEDIEMYAQTLTRVSERFAVTLNKLKNYQVEQIKNNLEYPGIEGNYSKNVVMKALEEYLISGLPSYELGEFYDEIDCNDDGLLYSEKLRMKKIIEEDWDNSLVPYVIEVLEIMDSEFRKEKMKNLIEMYIADDTLLKQSKEEKQSKYALINVGIEFCGGITELGVIDNLFNEKDIAAIASKTRNRRIKENELFDLYYYHLIEPIVFDELDFGKDCLKSDDKNFDLNAVIDKLQLPEALDLEVVKFVIEAAKTSVGGGDEFSPFYIWGSDRYMEIINRINKKSEEYIKRNLESDNKLDELIRLLEQGVDDADFKSLLSFGAKCAVIYEKFVYNKENDATLYICEQLKINADELIKEYADYEEDVRNVSRLAGLFGCISGELFYHEYCDWLEIFETLYSSYKNSGTSDLIEQLQKESKHDPDLRGNTIKVKGVKEESFLKKAQRLYKFAMIRASSNGTENGCAGE